MASKIYVHKQFQLLFTLTSSQSPNVGDIIWKNLVEYKVVSKHYEVRDEVYLDVHLFVELV